MEGTPDHRLHLPVSDIHPHDAGTKDDWVPRCAAARGRASAQRPRAAAASATWRRAGAAVAAVPCAAPNLPPPPPPAVLHSSSLPLHLPSPSAGIRSWCA